MELTGRLVVFQRPDLCVLQDCETVGRLIGKKMLITEFAAFPDLITEYDNGNGTLSKR